MALSENYINKFKVKNCILFLKLFEDGYLKKEGFQILEPFDRIQINIGDASRIVILGKYKNHPNNDMETSQDCPVLELPLLAPSRV